MGILPFKSSSQFEYCLEISPESIQVENKMARFLLLKDQKSKPHVTTNYRRVIDWNWYFTLKSLSRNYVVR